MTTHKPIDPNAARVEREWTKLPPLIGCRFDPTGRFLFASAQDSTIRRLDLLTGEQTTLAGHASWVRGMAFAPAPAFAAAAVGAVERARAGFLAAAGGAGATLPRAGAAAADARLRRLPRPAPVVASRRRRPEAVPQRRGARRLGPRRGGQPGRQDRRHLRKRSSG